MKTIEELRNSLNDISIRRHHAEVALQEVMTEERLAADELSLAVAQQLGFGVNSNIEMDYGRGRARGKIIGIHPPYDHCLGEFRVEVALIGRSGKPSKRTVMLDQGSFRPCGEKAAKAKLLGDDSGNN